MTVTRGEKIRLYFNGLQIAESVVNSTCDLSSKEALFVGYDMHYDKNFYGSVANIRMHNVSLSPTTINQLYQWDKNPSRSPTESPTAAPSNNPTASPTFEPTQIPSFRPSATPSTKPTMEPSQNPTAAPTFAPLLAAAYRLDGNWQDSVNLGSAIAVGIVWVGDRFGTPSTAAQFDGQSFVWGNNPRLPTAERTVVAWVKLLRDPAVGQGGEQNWTVVSYGGGDCGQGFSLSVHENGVSGWDGVEVQSNCGQDRLEFQTRSLGALVGSWTQLAVASSRSGTVLYVNGSEVANSDVFMAGTGGRGRFVLGGQLQGDGSLPVVGSFRGLLDNVAWYNRALATREIHGLFADQPPTVVTNNFQVMKSGATELSLTMVFGSASDISQQSSLVYSFKNIRHGFFSLKSEPKKSITSFSHERLMSMGALFTVDGSGIEPSFEFAVDDGNMQSSYVQANVVVVTSFAPSFRPSIAPTSTTNSNPSSPTSPSDDDASRDEVSNRDLIIGLPLAIGASISAAIIWYVIRCLIQRNGTGR
jgi:cell division septation protein DedD